MYNRHVEQSRLTEYNQKTPLVFALKCHLNNNLGCPMTFLPTLQLINAFGHLRTQNTASIQYVVGCPVPDEFSVFQRAAIFPGTATACGSGPVREKLILHYPVSLSPPSPPEMAHGYSELKWG